MAKPRPVTGIRPGRRLRPNARRVLAVRIDEVYGFEAAVVDPSRVDDLHAMRIACKRLRYLLEIFGLAFDADLEPYLDEVKALQDLLGDIHDRDVQIPRLQEHLEWLRACEAEGARALVGAGARVRGPRGAGSGANGGRGEGGNEAAFRRFRADLEGVRRGDERIGVHALVARRRHERDALYARFLDEWRRLKAERFRPRLEAALGVES